MRRSWQLTARYLLTMVLLWLLTACSSMMYHGFGFEEELSYPNGARIELRGNASTRKDYAMLRAAELTLERGHTHFVVHDLQDGAVGNDGALVQGRTYLTISMYTNPTPAVRNTIEANYIIESLSQKLELES